MTRRPLAPKEQLLAKLLHEWQKTHDPQLEPLICELGLQLARERGALSAKSKAALETAWHALAKNRDPADLDRLLDAAGRAPRPDLRAHRL